MRLLPYQRATLVSALPPKDLMERLRSSTGKWAAPWSAGNQATIFTGSVGEDHFKLQRRINYRNSFNPQLIGRVQVQGNLTTIELTLRLHPFVAVFMGLWCGGLLLSVIAGLALATGTGGLQPVLFVPMAMLVFGYVMTTGFFHVERSKALNELGTLLHATQV
jgi:hypothetical protein